MLNAADREAEKSVKLAHPLRVAAREVIVHRHEMRALAGERIQIKRQRRDQRLAFTGRHFRDAAPMQNHAADELHVEVDHVPGHRLVADGEGVLALRQAARRVFHHRKRFRQDFVQLRPLLGHAGNGRQLRLPGGRLRAEIVVGERLELLVQLVNATDSRHQALDFALIFRSEYFL